MDSLTRRGAIGFGAVSCPALVAKLGQAEAADESEAIFAGEEAVLLKVKDVIIEQVDRAGSLITARIGRQERLVRMSAWG
jgi:hypothetical protein